jgi:hypothetical protein
MNEFQVIEGLTREQLLEELRKADDGHWTVVNSGCVVRLRDGERYWALLSRPLAYTRTRL